MTKSKKGSWRAWLLGAVLVCLLVALSWGQAAAAEADGEQQILAEVREYVKNYFLLPVDEEVLNKPTVEELLKALNDPYSVYFTPEEYEDFLISTDQNYSGVGLQVELKDGYVTVVTPLKNTPAARVGIKSGDRIIAVNGENVVGKPMEYVVSLLRGKAGTSVVIMIERPGEPEPLIFVVSRENIHVEAVEARMLEDGIGYIAISSFTSQADEEFEAAVAQLLKQGMKALVLDLRENPGGYLSSGLSIASDFAKPGELLLHVVDRDGKKSSYQSLSPALNIPTVVLVNKGTASAAEIVAGAIQDLGAGKLVGTQTFGKGSVQTVYKLSNGGALKLTTAKYLTPLEREINGVGLTPDYVVEGEGAQLAKAVEILKAGLRNSAQEEGLQLVLTLGKVQAQLGEKRIALEKAPYLYQGRTMVPLRFVSEAFGGRVSWNGSTQSVKLTFGDEEILLDLGQKKAVVNGKQLTLDVPPQLHEGRTFVPLRFIAEALGAKVNYQQATGTITIVK